MEEAVEPNALVPWLKQALKAEFATVEKAIQKAKSETQRQIASLEEITADLLEKSEKDSAEKRSDRALYKSARAVGRMCQELQDIRSASVLADAQSYEGLRQFSDTVAKLASDGARIRDRWIGQIRPYYILDMMSLNASIDKLRQLGDQGWSIVSKEGSLLRRIEEIQSRVEKIEELQGSLQKQINERDQVVSEVRELERRIAEARRKIESLASDPKITELRKIDNRMRELRGDLLASGFRRLGRPLRKLESMAARGEYPLSPEVREKLSEYLKKPFTTFISEGVGYPGLKSVLTNMQEAVKRKRLLLKQREEKKVLERIDNVAAKNALDKIHHEATALMVQRRKSMQDQECLKLIREYRNQKQDLKKLESSLEELKHRSEVLSEKAETLRGSLVQLVKETELSARRLANRPVRIELDLAAPSD